MCDIMSSRIEANLGAVAAARLLDLPSDQTFTCDEFVAHQVGAWVGPEERGGGAPCCKERIGHFSGCINMAEH